MWGVSGIFIGRQLGAFRFDGEFDDDVGHEDGSDKARSRGDVTMMDEWERAAGGCFNDG